MITEISFIKKIENLRLTLSEKNGMARTGIKGHCLAYSDHGLWILKS